MQGHVLAATHAHAHLQPVETVQAADPFVVHDPALATEKHPDPQEPEAGPRMRDLANAEPQGRLVLGPAPPGPRGSTELRQPAGPHATDVEGCLEPSRQFSTA